MTLEELHEWAMDPRMAADVDLCTLWVVIGKHWPLLVARCPSQPGLRALGRAIDVCCAVRPRSKDDPRHPCCDAVKELGPDWPRTTSDEQRVTAILDRLDAALTRFCDRFSAASRSRES